MAKFGKYNGDTDSIVSATRVSCLNSHLLSVGRGN